jgi:DNA-binding transcriptional MerR regulator
VDKGPEAFRTISEVAEEMDLPQHVLRFWETRFPQIKPLKRGGGRRYYRPDDVELLRAVKRLLYGEGYTIKGVQKLLREQGAAMVARGFAGNDAEATKAAVRPAAQNTPAARSAADMGRGDIATLRAVLADLREAERLLSLSRGG